MGSVLSFVPKIKIFWFPRSRLGTIGSGIGNEGVAVGWVDYRAHRAIFVEKGSVLEVIHRAAVPIFQNFF